LTPRRLRGMLKDMELNPTIIEVTPENLDQYPGVVCFINPKHPCHHLKTDWMRQQYPRGLKVRLLYLPEEKRPVGYIESIPGENCWRGVDAEGWTFIHCIWTNGKKYQHQGLGKRLLEEVEADARGSRGVAVMVSGKAFMADASLFLKNGYIPAAVSGSEQILVKAYGADPLPVFTSGMEEAPAGLTLYYTRQCPWIARFIEEVKPVLKEEGLEADIIELTTPEEVRRSPSAYGGFSLVYDGRLLADRYISVTRFKNIVKKEIKER
jgi:GNAT superfamily N-acetyltransferase